MEQLGVNPTGKSEAALAWDDGCRADPIRNQFLVPKLIALLTQERPATILDVGTGTGYIPRQLDGFLEHRPEWTLVDTDPERMEVAAQRKPPRMRMQDIVGSIDTLNLPPEAYETVLLTFTLLESENPAAMLAITASLVAESGLFIIAVPDGWQDILTASDGSLALCRRFLNETVELPKIDKFTGSPYPFFAMRIETLIATVLRNQCVLEALEQGGPQGEVYMLVFRKKCGTTSATSYA